jgi:hypothetical protein
MVKVPWAQPRYTTRRVQTSAHASSVAGRWVDLWSLRASSPCNTESSSVMTDIRAIRELRAGCPELRWKSFLLRVAGSDSLPG